MLINHSVIYFLIKITNALLGFYTTVYLTTTLGVEQFGEYSQIISLTTLIGSVLYLPITASISRFLQQIDSLDSFIKTVYIVYLIVNSIFLMSIFLVCFFIDKVDYFFVISPLVVSKGINDINLEINRARLRPIRYGLQSVLQMCFFLVFLKYYSGNIESDKVIYILTISYVLISLILINYSSGKFNLKYFNKIFEYGKTLIFVYFLGFSFQIIDKQIVAYFLPNSYLSYYQVINTLSQSVLLLLISSFSMTCYPLMVKYYGKENFIAVNRRMFYLIFGISIPALLGFIAISPELVKIFFGDIYYINLKEILWVVPISVFNIAIAANYFDFSFKLTNNNLKQLKVYYLPLFIIIIGNVIFVGEYKIFASAMIFLIASIIMLISTVIEGRKYLKLYFDFAYISYVLLVSLIMYCTTFLVYQFDDIKNMILKIIIGIFVFSIISGRFIWKRIK